MNNIYRCFISENNLLIMSSISHRSVIIVLLLTILVFVESNPIEFNAKEESLSKSLVRQRRQVTVPQLVNALGIFLG
jgi:hypothetical protein